LFEILEILEIHRNTITKHKHKNNNSNDRIGSDLVSPELTPQQFCTTNLTPMKRKSGSFALPLSSSSILAISDGSDIDTYPETHLVPVPSGIAHLTDIGIMNDSKHKRDNVIHEEEDFVQFKKFFRAIFRSSTSRVNCTAFYSEDNEHQNDNNNNFEHAIISSMGIQQGVSPEAKNAFHTLMDPGSDIKTRQKRIRGIRENLVAVRENLFGNNKSDNKQNGTINDDLKMESSSDESSEDDDSSDSHGNFHEWFKIMIGKNGSGSNIDTIPSEAFPISVGLADAMHAVFAEGIEVSKVPWNTSWDMNNIMCYSGTNLNALVVKPASDRINGVQRWDVIAPSTFDDESAATTLIDRFGPEILCQQGFNLNDEALPCFFVKFNKTQLIHKDLNNSIVLAVVDYDNMEFKDIYADGVDLAGYNRPLDLGPVPDDIILFMYPENPIDVSYIYENGKKVLTCKWNACIDVSSIIDSEIGRCFLGATVSEGVEDDTKSSLEFLSDVLDNKVCDPDALKSNRKFDNTGKSFSTNLITIDERSMHYMKSRKKEFELENGASTFVEIETPPPHNGNGSQAIGSPSRIQENRFDILVGTLHSPQPHLTITSDNNGIHTDMALISVTGPDGRHRRTAAEVSVRSVSGSVMSNSLSVNAQWDVTLDENCIMSRFGKRDPIEFFTTFLPHSFSGDFAMRTIVTNFNGLPIRVKKILQERQFLIVESRRTYNSSTDAAHHISNHTRILYDMDVNVQICMMKFSTNDGSDIEFMEFHLKRLPGSLNYQFNVPPPYFEVKKELEDHKVELGFSRICWSRQFYENKHNLWNVRCSMIESSNNHRL